MSFACLDRPLDHPGDKARGVPVDLQRTGQVQLGVDADEFALVVRDFKDVARLDLAKQLLGLVEPGDGQELPDVQLILAEQLLHGVATPDGQHQGVELGLGFRDDERFRRLRHRHVGHFLVGGRQGRHARVPGRRHFGSTRYSRFRVARIQSFNERQADERQPQADKEPLKSAGFCGSFRCRWLVIMKKWTDRTIQVCIPRGSKPLLYRASFSRSKKRVISHGVNRQRDATVPQPITRQQLRRPASRCNDRIRQTNRRAEPGC